MPNLERRTKMDYLQFKRVYSNDLLHFGIKRKSGRYPYGSGERPFQREPGRKKIKGKEKDRRIQEERASKDQPTYIKKEFQSKEEKVRFLNTASNATEVLQYRDQLTQKEISDALERIKTIRALSGISQKEINAGWDAVDDAMKKVGKVKNWAKTGLDSYGVMMDIIDALSGSYPRKDQQSQGQKKKK